MTGQAALRRKKDKKNAKNQQRKRKPSRKWEQILTDKVEPNKKLKIKQREAPPDLPNPTRVLTSRNIHIEGVGKVHFIKNLVPLAGWY